MITEDYVSFETAKLLKEKGFDEDIDLWYDENGDTFFKYHYEISRDWRVRQNQQVYQHPTLQMVMKWLREVHKLGVFPSTYSTVIGNNITHNYGTAIVDLNTYELMTSDSMNRETYEEACDAAIKYCLENLI